MLPQSQDILPFMAISTQSTSLAYQRRNRYIVTPFYMRWDSILAGEAFSWQGEPTAALVRPHLTDGQRHIFCYPLSLPQPRCPIAGAPQVYKRCRLMCWLARVVAVPWLASSSAAPLPPYQVSASQKSLYHRISTFPYHQ